MMNTPRAEPSSPRVSVVVPTHNRPHTLVRALRSVLSQDFHDLEVIVVDDASSDDRPRQVVADIAATDARVRYVRRNQNGGASATRNTGIEIARGELIAFQDDDDEWLPGKLSRQVRLMDELGTNCVLFGGRLLRHVPSANPKVYAWPLERGGPWVERTAFINGYTAFLQTSVMRCSALKAVGGFDEGIPIAEDYELCLRLLVKGRLAALPDIVTMSYEQPQNLSNNRLLKKISHQKILDKHSSLLHNYPKARVIAHYEIALSYLIEEERCNALRHWLQAFSADWRIFRLYLLLPMLVLGPAAALWGIAFSQKIKRALQQLSISNE